MNADGSAVSRFTTTGATSPAWSTDGSKVAFISTSAEHSLQVFVAEPNGDNVRMVTNDSASLFGPCWSADGASIAFAVDNVGV